MNRVVEHRHGHKPCSRRRDSTRRPIRDRRIQSQSSVESKGYSCVCRTPAQAPDDGADAMSFDIYAEVTSKIVSMLEAGVVPWRCPIMGKGKAGWPQNLESRKPYRGVNVFLLSFTAWTKGYSSSYWLTFNQAKAKGGAVRKGEKSTMVVFWKPYETKDAKTGEPVTIPVLRYYNVFNAEQCEGITVPDAPAFEPSEFSPVEEAQRIVDGYTGGPVIEHRGTSAYYLPKHDAVHIPEPTRFATTTDYYSTLFH